MKTTSQSVALLMALSACFSLSLSADETIVLEGEGERRAALDSMQGKPAPALDLADWVNSEGIKLEDLKGKVVLLDFWGVWCGPCRALVPHLIEINTKYKDRGLVIVGVHTKSAADEAPAFIQEKEIPYAIGFDVNEKSVETYNVDSFPDIYLIDHKGVLRYADVSNGVDGNIERAVEQLLEEREEAESAAPTTENKG